MSSKESNNFWDTIGVISILLIAARLIKQLNENTSTQLYNQKALKELEDDQKFKEIYGRPRTVTPNSP